MLIRRKSSTDDEYHHEDPLGNFGVITGANAAVLSSNVYDWFGIDRYLDGPSMTNERKIMTRDLGDGLMLIGSAVFAAPSRALRFTQNDYIFTSPIQQIIKTLTGIACSICIDGCRTLRFLLHLPKGATCKSWCDHALHCKDNKKKTPPNPCTKGQNQVTISCGSAKGTVCLSPGQSVCCSGNGFTVVNGPCPATHKVGHPSNSKTN